MASISSAMLAKMIVQYEWILENVEEEPKTIVSKMILFRGEKVFRVGLKNLAIKPVLFFMAVDLNKIGMKVEEVMYGIQDSSSGNSPPTMSQLKKESIGDDGNLQLFKTNFAKQIVGKCTFVFRICIEGSVPDYSYQLSDRLVKDQLWEAAKSKNSVDVQLVVKGQQFYAHKAILAARSLVFAAKFTKEQPAVGDVGLHQIHIDGVKPSTVEHFLHFIYTGESMGPLANEDLLKLAKQYQLTTLAGLCRVALNKIEATQMVNLTSNLHKDAEISSSTIRPDKETEIFFDRTTPTFRCSSSFIASESGKSKCLMRYQNEDIFIADFNGGTAAQNFGRQCYLCKPVMNFSCFKHRRFGLKVEDVFCYQDRTKWFKMESKHSQKNVELLLQFTAQQPEFNLAYDDSTKVSFDVKTVSTIGNYYYEMMDDDWKKDFWFAATDKKQKLTDVEIFVGTVKVMEAHRVVLSARSPVLNAALSKITNTRKSIVTFGAEFDVDIVKHFLQFLYTGSFETSASKSTDYKQLLKLATTYKVETLKNICQLADSAPLDVEELTDCLLKL